MERKTIAVVGVVAVIIVVAAAFMILRDDGGSSSGSDVLADSYPTNLMIMGNANLDDYLDNRDVTYI